jgi:hypothetical protein
MRTFTDDEVNQVLSTGKPYSVVIVKSGPNYADDTALGLNWEHNRRNCGLRDDGVLVVVLRVMDDSDVYGVEVFDATVDDTIALMNGDPAVVAGVLTFEVHPCRGFPGDSLP